jgi:hypothetical protein
MGEVVCVAGASGCSANPFRVKWQLETRENPSLRIKYCRSIISQKIEASTLTLEKSIRRSEKWERAISVARRLPPPRSEGRSVDDGGDGE